MEQGWTEWGREPQAAEQGARALGEGYLPSVGSAGASRSTTSPPFGIRLWWAGLGGPTGNKATVCWVRDPRGKVGLGKGRTDLFPLREVQGWGGGCGGGAGLALG